MKRISLAAMADSPEYGHPPAPPPANKRPKKTRDLPNLSDCHCCNRRINSTNPKTRPRILTSEWRIVLLCNSCHNLVESSQCCSYCLTGISSSSIDSSFFECKRCHRRIHRNCVSKFSLCTGNGGDFSVCFDCWVPELLENDYNRVHGSRTKKKVKICGDSASLGGSRVCDSHDKGKSLEEMVNEANVAAQTKIALAVDAKDKAVTKAVVARRAVELASGALNFVVVDKGGDRGELPVEDDARLAIQLHRAMNSSPRIARNPCLLNTNSTNVPMLRNSTDVVDGGDANLSCTEMGTGTQTCTGMGMENDNSPKFKGGFGCWDVPKYNMETDSLSCRELNGLCLTGTRQDCVHRTSGMREDKCNGDSNGCLITYSRRGRASQEGRCKEEPDNCLLRMYSRRLSRVERHNAEHDRCFKTYSRRPSATLHCKNKLQYGGFNFEHGILNSAITVNSEESRAFANGS